MTPAEVRIVRRQLEGYRDLIQIAAEKEAEVERLHQVYLDLAEPSCIPISSKEGCSGRKIEKTELYHEIFSRQQEAEKNARIYRIRADRIVRFIHSIEDPRARILDLAYLKGQRYSEIGSAEGYSKEGIYRKIVRCLEQADSELAKMNGLL